MHNECSATSSTTKIAGKSQHQCYQNSHWQQIQPQITQQIQHWDQAQGHSNWMCHGNQNGYAIFACLLDTVSKARNMASAPTPDYMEHASPTITRKTTPWGPTTTINIQNYFYKKTKQDDKMCHYQRFHTAQATIFSSSPSCYPTPKHHMQPALTSALYQRVQRCRKFENIY